MIASVIGFVLTLVLGAFVFDKYNAYGEVPIPGTAKLHLPAGQVTVNFHTVTVGNSSGGGLPVPRLGLDIDPPPGVPNPKVIENDGTTTSVNNDIHRRVWIADISTEGDYIITTEGQVNGFIEPRLAFGHDSGSSFGPWVGISAGLFVIGLVGTIIASVRLSRAKRAEPIAWQVATPLPVTHTDAPVEVPSDQGVKIEQLKMLAALRDSGALTEGEFQAEKSKVLEGD
ncbi:SHOCT domain-containing protein [Mycobacterium sp.]|uniref:SHOCT domain-containing protein n=1 Tax=Mycobacterium sp. TaxID=1785 RepID=UPI003BAEDCC2